MRTRSPKDRKSRTPLRSLPEPVARRFTTIGRPFVHRVTVRTKESADCPEFLPISPCNGPSVPANTRPTERWPSGRRRTPGKCVGGRPSPGFESLSLRQPCLSQFRGVFLPVFDPQFPWLAIPPLQQRRARWAFLHMFIAEVSERYLSGIALAEFP